MLLRVRTDRRRRGAALLLSLLAVLAVGTISATLSRIQATMESNLQFSSDRRAALYVAEAGIAEATLAVSQGKSGTLGSEAAPAGFGRGVFWVESADLPDGSVQLECTAQVGTAEFVLEGHVVPNLNPVASRGFFGLDEVRIGEGTLVDGFDSSRGSYASQVTEHTPHRTTGLQGRIGTMGRIVVDAARPTPEEPLEPSSFAWSEWLGRPRGGAGRPAGAAVAGPGPSSGPGPAGPTGPGAATELHAAFDGFVVASGEAVLDGVIDVDPPGFLPPPSVRPETKGAVLGDVVVSGTQRGVGLGASVEVEGDVIVRSGATLQLEGPLVLSLSELRLERDARLLLDDGAGPIQLHLEGGLRCDAGSRFETVVPGEAGHGTSIHVPELPEPREALSLPAAGRFHGWLYAPGDHVFVPAGLRWLGSIMARTLETAPGARLSHDERFRIGGQGIATTPRLVAWQIIPVGDGLSRRLTLDPVLSLQRAGVTPVPSSAAAPETTCEVVYLDETGTACTHSGAYEDLPAPSKRVMSVRWTDERTGLPRRWLRPAGADPDGTVTAYRDKLDETREALDGPNAEVPSSLGELMKRLYTLGTAALLDRDERRRERRRERRDRWRR